MVSYNGNIRKNNILASYVIVCPSETLCLIKYIVNKLFLFHSGTVTEEI